MARRLNVVTAEVLSEIAAELRPRLVHLSSDLVFSGASGRGEYREIRPDRSGYRLRQNDGRGRADHRRPRARCGAVTHFRCRGTELFSRHAGAVDWIRLAFPATGRRRTLYYDEVRSATYSDDLNHVFRMVLAAQRSRACFTPAARER